MTEATKTTTQLAEPSGEAGPATDRDGAALVECPGCGSEVPAANRCEGCGVFLPGNLAAAVVGHRGARFWREHERLYREMQEEIAADLGHGSVEEAPAAARAAITGLVQALIIRDAAYRRVLEDGGPLSSKGRTRRAAKVQESYDRRVEAWVRRLGIDREPKPVPSLAEYMERRAREAGESDERRSGPETTDHDGAPAGTQGDGAAVEDAPQAVARERDDDTEDDDFKGDAGGP